MMGDSWIDDEGFSEQAYRFLRKIVEVYQTKDELAVLLRRLPSLIEDSYLETPVKNEIKNWLSAVELSVRAKAAEQELVMLRNPRVPVKPKEDKERFEAFKHDLFEVLKKHRVRMGAGYDGEIYVDHEEYDEDDEFDMYLENELTVTEEEQREVNDSVFHNL